MCGRCTTIVVLLILYCLYIVLQVQCTHLWIAQPIQCYPPVGGGAKVGLQPGANTPKTLVLSRPSQLPTPNSQLYSHQLTVPTLLLIGTEITICYLVFHTLLPILMKE